MILHGTLSQLLFVVGRNDLLLEMDSKKMHQGKDGNPPKFSDFHVDRQVLSMVSLSSLWELFSMSILLDRLKKKM